MSTLDSDPGNDGTGGQPGEQAPTDELSTPWIKATPEKQDGFDLRISSGPLSKLLVAYLEQNLNQRPPSRGKAFVKDYLPVLTPIAALALSGFVSYATILFNQRASYAASSETLVKLISKFGEGSGADLKKSDAQSENKMVLDAMEIAVYGEQALPALKAALTADDQNLRTGGVLVAQQMYRAETIPDDKLTKEVLTYYDNPAMRRGVIEWLNKMGTGLLDPDSRLAFEKLDSSFGSEGKLCGIQSPEVAEGAAEFLKIHDFDDSKPLVLGLLENCPADFEAAREQAATALPEIAKHLPEPERKDLVASLQALVPLASATLQAILNNSITEIQMIH